MAFHFDPQGHLKAQYGVRRQENNKFAKMGATTQKLYPSASGQAVYWMVGEVTGIREMGGMESGTTKMLMYPAVCKIDINAAKLSDFAKFGGDQYFLNNQLPVLPMAAGNVVFFGENKPGKTMWFGKMPLE